MKLNFEHELISFLLLSICTLPILWRIQSIFGPLSDRNLFWGNKKAKYKDPEKGEKYGIP